MLSPFLINIYLVDAKSQGEDILFSETWLNICVNQIPNEVWQFKIYTGVVDALLAFSCKYDEQKAPSHVVSRATVFFIIEISDSMISNVLQLLFGSLLN